MSQVGYIQAPTDSSGKRIANVAVTIPIGTTVVDKDGVQTQLAADATVFIQRVVAQDSSGNDLDFEDSTTHELLYLLLLEMQELNRQLSK